MKTIIPAQPGWFIAAWFEAEGELPACFEFEPIIAWQINSEQETASDSEFRWSIPISFFSCPFESRREVAIKAPDGMFYVDEMPGMKEAEALKYFERQKMRAKAVSVL